MRQVIKIVVCWVWSVSLIAQMDSYSHKREVLNIEDKWHVISIPDDMFGHLKDNYADIRIYGTNAQRDTIEAPYILRVLAERRDVSKVPFKIINKASNNKGHFFTLEVPSSEAINEIDLNIGQQNFDWQLKLEGSNTQNEWFTILDRYRILSIKNDQTNYSYTTLSFPNAKYRYFRIRINSDVQPNLKSAEVSKLKLVEGSKRNFDIKNSTITENKKEKRTEIEIELGAKLPVNQLKISTQDAFDFYRPIEIQYLRDSIKTEKGWRYVYQDIFYGNLNSIEEKTFAFKTKIANRFKIFIQNDDNQALSIYTIQVAGYEHQLIARFTEPASYFLTYGNARAYRPRYDIERFTNQIPKEMQKLGLGQVLYTPSKPEEVVEPLFKNKIWLWSAMLIIIGLLAFFSLKMVNNK